MSKTITDKIMTDKKDLNFWEGFDAAIYMVLMVIDNTDMHTLPIVLKEEILEEVDLYKKD